MKLSPYAKALVASGAALTTAVALSVDGEISLNDGLAIAAAGVGALLVYAVPNSGGDES